MKIVFLESIRNITWESVWQVCWLKKTIFRCEQSQFFLLEIFPLHWVLLLSRKKKSSTGRVVCCALTFLVLKREFLGISFTWRRGRFSCINNYVRSFTLSSWTFLHVINSEAVYFTVLMVKEWIYKVLVSPLKTHNHKVKLFLNLRKTQFKFKSITLKYF